MVIARCFDTASLLMHAATFLSIFVDTIYSSSGTSKKKMEVDTYLKFVEFLDECEIGKHESECMLHASWSFNF
jgi:hypothetical protein